MSGNRTRAKEVSESYESKEITFDPSTPGAAAKQFVSTNVQSAMEEAKAIKATLTTDGISRNATDAEVAAGSIVLGFARPDQIKTSMANFVQNWTDTVIRPMIPVSNQGVVTYGGSGSFAQMVATYAGLPNGSFVVFEEYYTYQSYWGNGTGTYGAYRRRTICKTDNAGWTWI